MHSTKPWTRLACLLTTAWIAGCASPPPADLASGAGWVAERHKVSDASVRRVDEMPELRFDDVTMHELELARAHADLAEARAEAVVALDAAHDCARRSISRELDRLDDEAWTEVNRRWLGRNVVPDADAQAAIRARIDDDLRTRYAADRARFVAAGSAGELDAMLDELHGRIRSSVKEDGRTERALPWLVFAPASAAAANRIYEDEPRGDLDHDFDRAWRFAPPPVAPEEAIDADAATTRHWGELVAHAPTIVQERVEDAAYAATVDVPGAVHAIDRADVEIDAAEPTVYAYAREVPIKGRRHVQLVYTIWYPEQARRDGGSDAETGRIDGLTLRVTLDDAGAPLAYETLDACGCHHRVYPTHRLEALAEAQYGAPLQDKGSAMEVCVPGHKDLIVTRIVADGGADVHPVIRCEAGTHAIVDVDVAEGSHAGEVRGQTAYALRPYDELEHLPLAGGGFTSMFYENGLVKNAQRKEGVYFTPLGMLSAGQPRQRGTQMIQFDDWDFDDPTLFERSLRWPDLGVANASAGE